MDPPGRAPGRALRHHAKGVFAAEALFGTAITNSDGRVVPVRQIAERHVIEDLGHIPSFAAWVRRIYPDPWMGCTGRLADPNGQDAPEDEKPTS